MPRSRLALACRTSVAETLMLTCMRAPVSSLPAATRPEVLSLTPVFWPQPAVEPVVHVTIVPREKFPLGHTVLKVNEQRELTYQFTRRYLQEQLLMVLAGASQPLTVDVRLNLTFVMVSNLDLGWDHKSIAHPSEHRQHSQHLNVCSSFEIHITHTRTVRANNSLRAVCRLECMSRCHADV